MKITPPAPGTVELLIEMFDRTPVKNVAASLALAPRRVVYLGDRHKAMEKELERYESLFRAREIKTDFSYVSVDPTSLVDLKNKLIELLQGAESCVVDITGGHEMAFVAMGQLMGTPQGNQIVCVSSNIRRGEVAAVFGAEWEKNPTIPSLTVDEQIALHGGRVTETARSGNLWARKNYQQHLDILEKALPISQDRSLKWNATISTIGGYVEPDSLNVNIPGHQMTQEQQELWGNKALFKALDKAGLIQRLSISSRSMSFSFPSQEEKDLLSKSGNLLETLVFLAMQSYRTRRNSIYFTDVKGGVVICWNGAAVTNGDARIICNEVDVIGMAGLVPYFVSCKNGKADEAELYKLCTVAEEFGGSYGVPILIMGDIEANVEARSALLNRAKEMGVRVIEGAGGMSLKELQDAIRKAVS